MFSVLYSPSYMGIREVIRKLPEKLKKPFPINTASFEDFKSLVEEEKGNRVIVQIGRRSRDLVCTRSEAVGLIGNFEYLIIYHSRASNGRKIIFTEVYARQFDRESGFGSINKRHIIALTGLVTANARLKEIKEKNSEISTVIEGFNEQALERKLTIANSLGIKPPSKPMIY